MSNNLALLATYVLNDCSIAVYIISEVLKQTYSFPTLYWRQFHMELSVTDDKMIQVGRNERVVCEFRMFTSSLYKHPPRDFFL